MKFIIIVFALGIERYFYVNSVISRFNWFESYLLFLKNKLGSEALWKGWLGVLMAIVPLLIVVFLLNYLVQDWLYGLGGLLFGLIILLYSFGPESLYHNLHQVSAQAASSEETKAKQSDPLQALMKYQLADEEQDEETAQVSAVFIYTNRGIVAPLFWFILLGPVGAILYRLSELFAQITQQTHSEFAHATSQSTRFQQVLDWIPARIIGFVYTLIGNFHQGVQAWLSYVWRPLASSDRLLANCGLAAMAKGEAKSEGSKLDLSLTMVDRSMLILLVLIAVFSIGVWVS